MFDLGNDVIDVVLSPIVGKAIGAGFNVLGLAEFPKGVLMHLLMARTLWTVAVWRVALVMAAVWQASATFALAQSSTPRGTLVSSDAGSVTADASVTLGTYAMTNLFWNLADENSIPPYEPDKTWAEAGVVGGLSFTRRLGGPELYGAGSVVGTRTLGTDPFDRRNQGALRLERAFVGWRTRRDDSWNLDISFGSQEYAVGTAAGGLTDAMLIRMGAGNGGEWGGQMVLPRKAWELSAIARFTVGRWRAEGFWLRPNELPSTDTRTELAGGKFEGTWSDGRSRAGVSFVGVPRSDQIYPRADRPGDFYVGGRDGLRSLHVYGYVTPLSTRLPTLTARVEAVQQRNPSIDLQADAFYAEGSYTFARARWTPSLSYTFAHFSGDDPETARYERFDPLYWGGSLYGTWFGANSSWALLNSNFNVHRVSAQFVATPMDFLTVQYNTFLASELFSPLQFGQATRPSCGAGGCTLVSGVADAALSQDLYAGWTHVFSAQLNMTAFAVTSWAGEGLQRLGGSRWNTLALILGWTY